MIVVDTIAANIEHFKCIKTLKRLNDRHLEKVKDILGSVDKLNTLPYEESNTHIDEILASLHSNWTALSTRFAINVENWAAQRRILLRCFENLAKKFESIRTLSSTARLFLSSANVVGSGIALSLQIMQNKWYESVLHASGAMGLSSLAVAFLEDYVSNTSIANAIEELCKDQKMFIKVKDDFIDLYLLDRRVQKLFPYGIDVRLLEFFRSHSVEDASNENKIELLDVLKPIDKLKGHSAISLVVILSNVGKDVSLLDDENFIQLVKKFSSSKFVKEWWNRASIVNLNCFSSSTVPEAISKFQAFLKKERLLIPVPLLTTPAMHYEGILTILSIFLNSLTAVEAFFELNQKDLIMESTLSDIKHTLKTEYNEVIQWAIPLFSK